MNNLFWVFPKEFTFCSARTPNLLHYTLFKNSYMPAFCLLMYMLVIITAADSGCCLNQAFLICTRGRTGEFPVGEISRPQTGIDVVAKQSLGSWSLLWSLNNVSGCGSTSLFGSRAGTHQIRDQSRALEDRNDSNNSLEVYTPNSFIHLFYNSPYMDVVDMHNVLFTPSDSVLWEKTVEASYLVGSFPCQLSQISLTDIPVWDEVWEQATFRHLCTLW